MKDSHTNHTLIKENNHTLIKERKKWRPRRHNPNQEKERIFFTFTKNPAAEGYCENVDKEIRKVL